MMMMMMLIYGNDGDRKNITVLWCDDKLDVDGGGGDHVNNVDDDVDAAEENHDNDSFDSEHKDNHDNRDYDLMVMTISMRM